LILDAEESQRGIWPGQATCHGPSWTWKPCWKAEGRRFDPAPDHQFCIV